VGKLREVINDSWEDEDGVFILSGDWIDCPRPPADVLVDDIRGLTIKHESDKIGYKHLYVIEPFSKCD